MVQNGSHVSNYLLWAGFFSSRLSWGGRLMVSELWKCESMFCLTTTQLHIIFQTLLFGIVCPSYLWLLSKESFPRTYIYSTCAVVVIHYIFFWQFSDARGWNRGILVKNSFKVIWKMKEVPLENAQVIKFLDGQVREDFTTYFHNLRLHSQHQDVPKHS